MTRYDANARAKHGAPETPESITKDINNLIIICFPKLTSLRTVLDKGRGVWYQPETFTQNEMTT
eukprot:975185-Amphidinium_carterae.1